ncbi:GxxExxY protein [Pedobacter sp. MW01-1-1]|uniref:GxxExxY protein n=1 Tax=Pedobacter sp. MW01-1-1 TaxID=3383027 RepID=UPI003FEEDFC8
MKPDTINLGDHSLELEHELLWLTTIFNDLHRQFGNALSEESYKRVLKNALLDSGISIDESREFYVNFNGFVLQHTFFADFVLGNKIILEVRSSIRKFSLSDIFSQLIVEKPMLAILVNFYGEELTMEQTVLVPYALSKDAKKVAEKNP